MKKLTAEEFAAMVMKNGTEIEYEEWESKARDCQVWAVWAHVNEYTGEVVWSSGKDIVSFRAFLCLESQEQSEQLMNGELADCEKQLIIDELYPKYVEMLEDL